MALFNEVCEGTTGFVGTQDTTFIPNLFSFLAKFTVIQGPSKKHSLTLMTQALRSPNRRVPHT